MIATVVRNFLVQRCIVLLLCLASTHLIKLRAARWQFFLWLIVPYVLYIQFDKLCTSFNVGFLTVLDRLPPPRHKCLSAFIHHDKRCAREPKSTHVWGIVVEYWEHGRCTTILYFTPDTSLLSLIWEQDTKMEKNGSISVWFPGSYTLQGFLDQPNTVLPMNCPFLRTEFWTSLSWSDLC